MNIIDQTKPKWVKIDVLPAGEFFRVNGNQALYRKLTLGLSGEVSKLIPTERLVEDVITGNLTLLKPDTDVYPVCVNVTITGVCQ